MPTTLDMQTEKTFCRGFVSAMLPTTRVVYVAKQGQLINSLDGPDAIKTVADPITFDTTGSPDPQVCGYEAGCQFLAKLRDTYSVAELNTNVKVIVTFVAGGTSMDTNKTTAIVGATTDPTVQVKG